MSNPTHYHPETWAVPSLALEWLRKAGWSVGLTVLHGQWQVDIARIGKHVHMQSYSLREALHMTCQASMETIHPNDCDQPTEPCMVFLKLHSPQCGGS